MATVTEQAKQSAQNARAADQKLVEHSRGEYHDRMKGRPTPTQEECDLIKLGASLKHKSDSGAGPDPVYARTAIPSGPARR